MSIFFIFCSLMLLISRILITRSEIPISIIMLMVSLICGFLASFYFGQDVLLNFFNEMHFDIILLEILLPFFLYAGAIGLSKHNLYQQARAISLLSIFATLFSIILLTIVIHYLTGLYMQWSILESALLATILSPTDPVAVLGLIKHYRLNNEINSLIAGESLFNDGIGIVVYTTLMQMITLNIPFSMINLSIEFLQEVSSGLILGYIFAQLAKKFHSKVFEHEFLLDIALVLAVYHLGLLFHCSGAIAVVVLGIEASERLNKHYIEVWESIDLILNIIIYALIGFMSLLFSYSYNNIFLFITILINLFWIRALSIYIPLKLTNTWSNYKHLANLMIIGALKGGLALALALSLPNLPHKDSILMITYCIVCFSVLIQGNIVKFFIARLA